MKRDELLQAYAAGKRVFSRASLTGADLHWANLGGADLRGADLRGADLGGADLRGADLRGAGLRGAGLHWANLGGADLRGASLTGANLGGADLRGAKFNWMSHDLIAEVLRQAAGDDVGRRKLAGLVLVSRDWCWVDFLRLRDRNRAWALDVLTGYVQDGDNAPELLRRRAVKLRTD